VRVYHFVGEGVNDREQNMAETVVGDLEAAFEFLMRAVRKVEAIREDLGKVGPVIAEQVEEAIWPAVTARRPSKPGNGS
jgi:phage tail tape-measure protein